jgi:iron complex transport system substrate-binding protein
MPRIVSLIASATEITHALGLGEFQVGRSHECDYPPQVKSLPICTSPSFSVDGSSAEIDRLVKQKLAGALSIYDVSVTALEQLQPTHIITQTQCKVCAVSLEDVERALADSVTTRPRIVALEPNALADIWADIRRVADACDVSAAGETLVTDLYTRMNHSVTQARAGRRRPRVACIEWPEPLMAAGNWVPELIEMANADNLFGQAGLHSPWMSWDELVAADPDVIVSMPCGYDLAKTRSEMYWLTSRPGWHQLRAVQQNEIYLVDGNQYMNRPGPRVVESLQTLAEILHPDVFPPTLHGVAWLRSV